jgi:hypothetical protein
VVKKEGLCRGGRKKKQQGAEQKIPFAIGMTISDYYKTVTKDTMKIHIRAHAFLVKYLAVATQRRDA